MNRSFLLIAFDFFQTHVVIYCRWIFCNVSSTAELLYQCLSYSVIPIPNHHSSPLQRPALTTDALSVWCSRTGLMGSMLLKVLSCLTQISWLFSLCSPSCASGPKDDVRLLRWNMATSSSTHRLICVVLFVCATLVFWCFCTAILRYKEVRDPLIRPSFMKMLCWPSTPSINTSSEGSHSWQLCNQTCQFLVR